MVVFVVPGALSKMHSRTVLGFRKIMFAKLTVTRRELNIICMGIASRDMRLSKIGDPTKFKFFRSPKISKQLMFHYHICKVMPSNVAYTARALKLEYEEWDYTQPSPQVVLDLSCWCRYIVSKIAVCSFHNPGKRLQDLAKKASD